MKPTLLAAATALVALPALAAEHEMSGYEADVRGLDGQDHGTVTLQPTASGQWLVTLDLFGVPSGEHGVHFHETGDCSAADFTSAGGHIAGDADHGVMAEGGPHPGDLPNAMAGENGVIQVEYFNERITEDMLADEDGAAFIVHQGVDDYESQPSGAAGDRIACGEIVAAE
ncbi:superoxide dismutase family protein [Histidinibacterium aquaticum]|uniref:Superoxide dismutase family protein n=1 Tax=Histidinibacterium aquaticum TaxID=2613962 RepID=A0A5J5GKS6_9RHOB|nr:superoxide dismutase family protein [Histidinibacterium aquaticum]KAA9008082.1 superoxide dismutase family protein [Histidinibacterium aquaticum]